MTHPGDPITTLDDVRAPHNVVAAVTSLDEARRLIEALENDGIEPSAISLLGAYPVEAGDDVAPAAEDTPRLRASKAATRGAAVGATSAAALGVAVGVPGLGPVMATGLWAVFGAAAGATYALPAALGVSNAWTHTFETVRAGNFAVGVHSTAAIAIDSAASVMESFGVMNVNRFDD